MEFPSGTIESLSQFCNVVEISALRINLRLMTASFMMGEERKLIADNMAFLLDMQSLIDFLEALEKD